MFEEISYLDMEYARTYLLFEDDDGTLLTADELDELSPWEIEDRKIRVFERNIHV